MAQKDKAPDRTAPRPSLRGARVGAWLAMSAERLAPLVLPLVTLILLFLALAWFGLFRAVPDLVRIALVGLSGLAALAALWPLRHTRWPTAHEVDRRLERDNQLLHTPITIEQDRLSGTPDARSQALWEAHKQRMADRTRAVGGIDARTSLPERDPWALRAVAPMLAVIAFAFSFSPQGGSLLDAFRSNAISNAAPMRVDAWITPPGYTGIAPIFMTSQINAEKTGFTVPEGSVAKIRLAGGTGQETALFDGAAMPLSEDTAESASARAYEIDMRAGGTLSVARGGETLNAWSITITEDNAPDIYFADEDTRLSRAANGTWTLTYFATDDYRLRAARAVIELQAEDTSSARPLYGAPELDLVLPRRSARDGAARTTRDLTEHPWAGAPIRLTLEAEDDLAQLGVSSTIETVLPGRPFSNPLARALMEQRRNLALDANRAAEIIDVLDTLTLYPEETIDNAAHFLGLTTARIRLEDARNDDDLRDVVDYLWEIARHIEDGNLSDAERRLRQAQQALQDALENGASDEEIAQLMDELRDAMQDYMRELVEQMQRNPQAAQQMPQDGEMIDRQTLDDMLNQIEEMARSGMREQAMDMLSQLNTMMNNLQMAQPQQGQGQNQAQQQMNELGDILREQQELMDETFRQNRQRRQQGQQQQGQNQQPGNQGQQGEGQKPGEQGQAQNGEQQGQGQGQGQNGQQGEGLQGLAPGQQALQDRLNQFMQGLRDMGIDPGQSFGDAGESMEGAGEALGEGEGESALAQQGDAMDALREGANQMMEQMQQQAQQNGQGTGQQNGNQRADDRDPLGRPQRSSGPDFGNDIEIPDEIDVRRARQILEAIRERLGDALSPQLEREYLERLLDLN